MKTLIIALLISSVVSGQNISLGMSHAKDMTTGNGMVTHHGQKKDSLKWYQNYRPHVFLYDEYPTFVGRLNDFVCGPAVYHIKDTVPFIGVGVQIGEIFFGQLKPLSKDTLPTMITTDPPINGYFIMRPADTLKPLPRDTIRALFLVTDTSLNKPSAFAVKGYEVYKRNGTIDWLQKRLDSNKKPLPNTWVVWQTSIY